MYRLPKSVNIRDFWPEELKHRREQADVLPLRTYDGQGYWFVRTDAFARALDEITRMARDTMDLDMLLAEWQESLIDEALFLSMIEGAFSTREQAHRLLESGNIGKIGGLDEEDCYKQDSL